MNSALMGKLVMETVIRSGGVMALGLNAVPAPFPVIES
jgi:hypothetical protein